MEGYGIRKLYIKGVHRISGRIGGTVRPTSPTSVTDFPKDEMEEIILIQRSMLRSMNNRLATGIEQGRQMTLEERRRIEVIRNRLIESIRNEE